ncbi:probable WRKY transcription factor 75 isoform X2 [Phoenix dactylifera]|uniref:Probable WRKY transcription factor 75 isoform X2 n=1 Tax=Phoenix dactylifera TaxID=42345 RepID=A0A8B8ZHF7_PHODC|nr:probable WRKY transcription factor 75 isoform X2 [Phoenix dactylifera]
MSLMEPLEGEAPPFPHFDPCFSPPLVPPGYCPPGLSNQRQQQQEPSSLGCGEAPAIDWASLFLPSSIGLQQPTPAGLLQSLERPSEAEGNATKGGGGCCKEKGKGGRAKKVSRPRFAFQTRSANDILDDGYRWRKYGQKAVKNSIYPSTHAM